MALARSSMSRRGSKNDAEKDDKETENNGYIQVLVRPLEQGSCGYLLKWLGFRKANLSAQQLGVCYGAAAIASGVLLYQLLRCDAGILFHRLCSLVVPMFSILCAFYWLSLYFRRTWSNTSIYLLFCSCYMGEFFAQVFLRDWGGGVAPAGSAEGDDVEGDEMKYSASLSNYTTQPLVIVCVLLFISVGSVFSSLETSHSAGVILLVSFTRFLTCSSLQDVPYGLRPFIAYTCGFAGNIVAKYMESTIQPPIQNLTAQDGKIPVIKRRRSSSSNAHAFSAHRSARRTSLPALIQKSQSSSAGYESAIIGEAHGLITDMLANTSLPPHIISGLRAVSNLLKPPDAQGSFHKPRVSPLVSLTENTNYGSDSEESPYTGERPSTLPKRLRRSLPPSLIRRMSTSTWTTTTSATGMPTLEPEPCRVRSSSFRHSREGTPGSSPNDSRSNSPSPSAMSNSTTVLTIPKSRSFSLAAAPGAQLPYQRRFSSRKSTANDSAVGSYGSSPTRLEPKPVVSPLARPGEASEGEEAAPVKILAKDVSGSTLIQKRLITSDYESSDSPSCSDFSDAVVTADDGGGGSSPRKELRIPTSSVTKVKEKVKHLDEEDTDGQPTVHDDDDGSEESKGKKESLTQSKIDEVKSASKVTVSDVKEVSLLFDPEQDVERSPLLQIRRLNEWDYPIFDLAEAEGPLILTKVAYKLFTEVGLMETFRIPLPQFLNYFHDLELGYQDKPYHNRIHATDVLHGVYYLTTQPIPGFTQVCPGDGMSRPGSSSDSDTETVERSFKAHRSSFMAEDSYGIMGGNLPALELMALYTAAAMHDFDHPGRTNAFLVATTAPQAVLYNDRSVLENHHAASAWSLLLNQEKNYFIAGLEAAEFKRFRFLVIEAILATDLKRHFEILAEFNAKVNDEEAAGIDWTLETDRLLVTQMVIKLADINGPSKKQDLHQQWTFRIAEEFYEQGDEEASLGLPISPYMDRRYPQLAKLQETFINHLVAPLCNAIVTGGLLPGTWVEEDPQEVADRESFDNSTEKDTEDEDNDTDNESGLHDEKECKPPPRKVNCLLTKNLKDNYEYWNAILKQEEEEQRKAAAESEAPTVTVIPPSTSNKDQVIEKTEMEPIEEESESPPLSVDTPPTSPHQASTLTASSNSAFHSKTSLPTPSMDADRSTAV